MIVVYLRNVGTEEDQCWVVCAKGDPGAVEFSSVTPHSQPEPIGDAFPTPDERRGRDRQFYWNGFWLGLGIGVAFGSLIHQIFR